MKKVKVLYPFNNSTYQSFLQDMADCLIGHGVEKIDSLSIPWSVRHIAAKSRICFNMPLIKSRDAIIVLAGGYVDASAFPFCYCHEIIPVLWDTWPRYWGEIVRSFKRNRVKLAFFTQRQTAEYIQSQLPNIKCVHLPEGIKSNRYIRPLKMLSERTTDILEIGRTYKRFHDAMSNTPFKFVYPKDGQLLFPTFQDMLEGLNDSKIVVCFPRSMTNPKHAGDVETLTQRYWECMLSRNIMLGHAPKELVELCGYNPVVEADFSNLEIQITNILYNINSYQDMVDRNYNVALKFADWSHRLPLIIEAMKRKDYEI